MLSGGSPSLVFLDEQAPHALARGERSLAIERLLLEDHSAADRIVDPDVSFGSQAEIQNDPLPDVDTPRKLSAKLIFRGLPASMTSLREALHE